MRKSTLLAVALLLATTATAQTVAKRSVDTPSTSSMVVPQLDELDVITDAPEAPAFGAVAIIQDDGNDPAMATKIEGGLTSLNPELTLAASRSSVKDATLQTSYTGYGDDYRTDSLVSWTMSTGTATTSSGTTVDVLIDVIPNYFAASIDYIPVEYTLASDGTLTIPAQVVATTTSYYIFLCSSTTDDGSIVMSVADDGAITTTSSDRYLYGAFTTSTFDPSFTSKNSGGTYAGYYEIEDNPAYYYDGQAITPEPEMEPDCMYLHASLSYTSKIKNSSLAMIPAYSPVNFKNFTAGSQGIDFTYDWSVSLLSYDSETAAYTTSSTTTADTEDFTYYTESGTYGPVTLNAIYGTESGSYTWGCGVYKYASASHYAYAGCQMSSLEMSDGSSPLIGRASYDFGYSRFGYLATPDINTSSYSISDLILYQGKPSAPLYITGVNYLMRAAEFVDSGITLTCILRRCERSSSGTLALGDTIAMSNTVSYLKGSSHVSLEFADFYTFDEDGLTTSLDHIFIEDEFAVQFSGWDNGTFTAYPYGEYTSYYPDAITNTFCYFTGETSLRRFPNLKTHQYVGFLGVVYGYLYTEDSTDLTFTADGGSATITVNPFMCSVDSSSNKSTRLYVDDSSEVPDWLTLSTENENYSESPWSFDLVVTADAISDGTESRTASFRLYQEGAVLDITVTQTSDSGVTSATISTQPAVTVDGDIIRISGDYSAEVYTVAGQRVAAGASQIDASALATGVYIVKLSDGTATKIVK